MHAVIQTLLWFSALGCGVMAGVYFAFSTFIMTALGTVAPRAGIAAMTAINRDILRSLFMPLFFGTTLSALALAGMAAVEHRSAAAMMAIGGIVHVFGMFGVTMARNVPLNSLLAAADPDSAAGQALWDRYRRDWTRWNHVRTLASLLASALFVAALIQD